MSQAQEVMGYLGAIQTLCEKFPMNFKLNYIEFPTSFDFIIDILKLLGVDNRELITKLADKLTDDKPGGFLDIMEESLKWVLRVNIGKLAGCDINPIIPDSLIAPAQGDDEYGYFQIYEGENYGTNHARGGINLDLSLIDIMGYLKVSPLSENGKHFYFDVDGYGVNELYKSTDFNVFLWYVVNKGMSAPLKERQKLTWDNRVKYCRDRRKEQKTSEWLHIPENWFSINEDSQITDPKKKIRKKVIDVVYIDNGTASANKLNIKISPEEYYRVRKWGKNQQIDAFRMNKSIYEFNHDYLNSMKLLHKRPILTSIVNTFTGDMVSNISVNYSLTEKLVQAQVDKIIKNLVKLDSTEIEDCYFSFSNDDFNSMLEESEAKMLGKYINNGAAYTFDADSLLNSLDTVSSAANKQEEIAAIENTFFDIQATPAKDGDIETSDSISFGAGWIVEVIKSFIYPIIKVLLSPKVIVLFHVYSQVMGKPCVDIIDLLMSIISILKNLIKMVIDMVIKWLLDFLISKLKPILELFASILFIEMLNEYRALLQIMLDCLVWFKFNKVKTAIDDVNYADITKKEASENITKDKC